MVPSSAAGVRPAGVWPAVLWAAVVRGGRVAVSERRPRISEAAQALILGVGMTGVLSLPGLRCGPEHVDGQAPEAVPEGEGLLAGVEDIPGDKPCAVARSQVA